jgi:hypothetical protein
VGDEDRNKSKRMQRTDLAMWSIRPSGGHDLSLVGLQTIGRIGVDTGCPVAIDKGLLLAVVQRKAAGRHS